MNFYRNQILNNTKIGNDFCIMFALKLITNNNFFIVAFTQNQHEKPIKIAFNTKIYHELIEKFKFSIHKFHFEKVICDTDVKKKEIHLFTIRFDMIFFQAATAKMHI